MFSWGSHIEGAISLVKQRGRKQLRTKTGLLLFIAVRTQMIIHTLTSGKAPIMGVDWWISDAVKDSSAAECQKINIKTSELRAEVTRLMTTVARTPENIELMLTLIRRAQTVDRECVQWMKNVPDSWGYKSVAWEDSVPSGDFSRAEVFPGRVDVYRDFYIASVWNMVRVTRLVLASVIVRCAAWVCSPVDYRTTPEYATAARTCVDTITDIIASVPYHLGWHLKPERKHLLEKQLSGFACGDDDSLKGLAGYFLTWPLGCVQSQDYTTDAQRSWLKGRLRYIADELGVKYAHILCQVSSLRPARNHAADIDTQAQRAHTLHADPQGRAHGAALPHGPQLCQAHVGPLRAPDSRLHNEPAAAARGHDEGAVREQEEGAPPERNQQHGRRRRVCRQELAERVTGGKSPWWFTAFDMYTLIPSSGCFGGMCGGGFVLMHVSRHLLFLHGPGFGVSFFYFYFPDEGAS